MIPRRHAALFFYSIWFIIFALMTVVRAGSQILPGHLSVDPVTPAYAAEPRRTPTPEPTAISTATAPTPTIAVPTPVITPIPAPAEPVPVATVQVALTFYTCPPFCLGDLMANTQPLHAGAVACGYAFDTGQRFLFGGVEYVCEDRGAGPYYWIDFWKETYAIGQSWQAQVGMSGAIELLR